MITRRFLLAGGALGVMAAVGLRMGRTAAQEQAHVVVPPTIDETRGQSTSEIAVVAGGSLALAAFPAWRWRFAKACP